jgi:hypothetical protein
LRIVVKPGVKANLWCYGPRDSDFTFRFQPVEAIKDPRRHFGNQFPTNAASAISLETAAISLPLH